MRDMTAGTAALALCATAAVAGCGGSDTDRSAAGACGADAGAAVSGPFCLTAGTAARALVRDPAVRSCGRETTRPSPRVLPRPVDTRRCTTRDGTRLDLMVFASANHALRARPSAIAAAGLRPVPDRAVTASNLIVVAEQLTEPSLRALAAAGRLGDRAG